jgi:hypothetical protein
VSEERLYTAEEVARLQDTEVKLVLKGLLRNLEDVRTQRGVSQGGKQNHILRERMRGEIEGLNIAIAAIKRRIR